MKNNPDAASAGCYLKYPFKMFFSFWRDVVPCRFVFVLLNTRV